MNCPKSVRTAAIVSQVFIVVWAALSFLSSIFQKDVVGLFFNGAYFEDLEKIVPVTTIVLCFKALFLSAANVLMCKGKSVYAPLIMTAVTMGVFPIVTAIAKRLQLIYYARQGSDFLSFYGTVSNIEAMLSGILSTAAIITVAAAAVYAYAKKNENAGESSAAETEYKQW